MSDPNVRLAEAPPASGTLGACAAPPPGGQRLRLSIGMLILLVLCVQLLPSLPLYMGMATSMAAGTVIAAGICIVTVAVCWAVHARSSGEGVLDVSAGGMVLIGTVVVLVALHGAVAEQIQGIDESRFLESFVPLLLLLAAGLALSTTLRGAAPSHIVAMSWVSFWVLCGIIALKVTGLQPRPGVYSKPAFPFTETSHFVLTFGPIFLYRCANARRSRRSLWVFLGFALAIGLQSGSLLAIAFVAAMVCRRTLVVSALALAVALAGLGVDLAYFTGRADISDSSSNLSALVYLEGWEMLDRSLVQSDGWGLGFQQLGVRPSDVPAAEAIARLKGTQGLNQMDGSFVVSKLGSEFGVAGLLLVMAYCGLAFRSLRCLRAGRGPPAVSFAHSIVLAYGADMFVRGTGYFASSGLLFVAAVLVLAPEGGFLRADSGAKQRPLMVLR